MVAVVVVGVATTGAAMERVVVGPYILDAECGLSLYFQWSFWLRTACSVLLTVRIRILWARCLLLFTWRRSWRCIFGGVLERCWFHRFHTYWNFVCIEKIRAAPHNKEDELPNPSKRSKSMLQRREVAHQQKIRYRNRKQLAQHVAATPHKTWGDVCGFGRFVNSQSKIYNK